MAEKWKPQNTGCVADDRVVEFDDGHDERDEQGGYREVVSRER